MSHFNPRPPWGGRPNTLLITLVTLGFQSTPSVGRATEGCRGSKDQKEISIHALRGEGDVFFPIIVKCFFISIHALRGEGDDRPAISLPLSTRFQSTPSVGRATINMPSFAERLNISIHALRGEGDEVYYKHKSATGKFQSTPSVGRATRQLLGGRKRHAISIHALRGEGDAVLRFRP